MARSSSSPSARRRIDFGAVARQANHVVAAAVFVFGASILLGSVLATPVLTPSMAWILRNWGETAGLILGPLFIDGMYVLLLLAVAFPFGRVTAARPWISGPALVLLVYGCWLSFHYVTGDAEMLYNHWAKIAARAVLLLLTVVGVARLMARGRRAALEVDRPAPADAPGGGDSAEPGSAPGSEPSSALDRGDAPDPPSPDSSPPAEGPAEAPSREDGPPTAPAAAGVGESNDSGNPEEPEGAPARDGSSAVRASCKQRAPAVVLEGVR